MVSSNTAYPANIQLPASMLGNGDRYERVERSDYNAGGESPATRRTSFRRPVQQTPLPTAPVPPVASVGPTGTVVPPVSLPTPTHEIALPLGNLLHLAHNPSYTGADEARSKLLHQLAHETKTGGRARCWSCGSLAIAYDYWNTRSKNFGEVGVAVCEICGVWSVM
jgi:hypothetical protein